jgi:hypothetical protein
MLETDLNIILLFLVIIEPYLFYLLRTGASDLQGLTSVLFALDIAGTMFALGAFYAIGIKDYRGNKSVLVHYKYTRNGLVLTAAIFAISALPIFNIELKSAIWLISLGMGFVFRRMARQITAFRNRK